MKAIKKRVADRDLRDLLWKFLRAGVIYKGECTETLAGTPQGGIVSPLLANIYLHELDRYMESNYLNLSNYARGRRRVVYLYRAGNSVACKTGIMPPFHHHGRGQRDGIPPLFLPVGAVGSALAVLHVACCLAQ
jgi:hypothetical protein